MISPRLLNGALRTISVFAFAFCLLFGWLFYSFYFKWLSLFEDGRYYDPEAGVVYHDSGFLYGVISIAALIIAIALMLIAMTIEGRRRGVVDAEVGS